MRDYRPVLFAHIPIEPGEAVTLTADPWSFARGFLIQAHEGRRGRRARDLRRALYYARLAEGFYGAMNGAQIRTRGVLAYYGMLNLAKCFLATNGVELESVTEHHGMIVPLRSDHTVRVLANAERGQVNLLAAFARALGTPVPRQFELDFIDACAQVPELHQLMNAAGHISKPAFLPIGISFCVTPDKKKLFAELAYDKGHETRLSINNFLSGDRAKHLKEPIRRNNTIVHQTKTMKKLTRANWPAVYRNYIKQFNSWDIASILTKQGYRYYCNLDPGPLHHLCYSLITIFYIGSISRYRPTVVEASFAGKMRSVTTESLALIPEQFMYQMVSRLTNALCVVPFAKL